MPAFSAPVTGTSLLPGTVVSIWVFPIFRHRGIVSDRFSGGEPMVISNSARAGRVAEEPWHLFAAGQRVLVEGYPSNLLPSEVVSRARSLIGKAYDLLRWNCEHLTSYAHGQQPASPQVAATATALVLGGLIALASAK